MGRPKSNTQAISDTKLRSNSNHKQRIYNNQPNDSRSLHDLSNTEDLIHMCVCVDQISITKLKEIKHTWSCPVDRKKSFRNSCL